MHIPLELILISNFNIAAHSVVMSILKRIQSKLIGIT